MILWCFFPPTKSIKLHLRKWTCNNHNFSAQSEPYFTDTLETEICLSQSKWSFFPSHLVGSSGPSATLSRVFVCIFGWKLSDVCKSFGWVLKQSSKFQTPLTHAKYNFPNIKISCQIVERNLACKTMNQARLIIAKSWAPDLDGPLCMMLQC